MTHGTRPPENPHFLHPRTWKEAAKLITFEPRIPTRTLGRKLHSLAVFYRDHKHRELPIGDRSLEAHYLTFSISQCRKGEAGAREWALEKRYGQAPRPVRVAGHDGRIYDLGPVPPPDDIDPRPPAIVVWHDGDMLYLVASGDLESDALLRVAESMYPGEAGRRSRRP